MANGPKRGLYLTPGAWLDRAVFVAGAIRSTLAGSEFYELDTLNAEAEATEATQAREQIRNAADTLSDTDAIAIGRAMYALQTTGRRVTRAHNLQARIEATVSLARLKRRVRTVRG